MESLCSSDRSYHDLLRNRRAKDFLTIPDISGFAEYISQGLTFDHVLRSAWDCLPR